ncbi:MAG TPA: PAS domain S-box protein [Ilumatobacteraceae bacterium]|nr:PAS domain S-box protein [Ilumatobacteraceae bacterium]
MTTAGTAEAIITNAPDAILVVADDGTVLLANPAAVSLTGYAESELVGGSVEDLVPMEARIRHVGLRQDAVNAHVVRPMSASNTLHLARADGELIPVEIALAAVGDGRYTAIIRDASARLSMEHRLDLSESILLLAQERERIARDLHDTVLQRLFGLGLELQALEMRSDPATAARIGSAVDEIDLVIGEVRTAVFTLGSAHRDGSFGQELGTIIAQASRVLGFTPHLRINGPVEAVITDEIRTEVVASLREALTNVARHAQATVAHVELEAADGRITARVTDNGCGPGDQHRANMGNGLRNLRRRAQMLGGNCLVGPGTGGGTELLWSVPVPA